MENLVKEALAGFIDWLEIGNHNFLVSLGLLPSGDLRLMHVNEGAYNDFKTVHEHLEYVYENGFVVDRPILFVINGSTCLRNIVPGILGEKVVLQRCQLRYMQELIQSLPEESKDQVKPHFEEFMEMTYTSSLDHLKSWMESFQNRYPTVAANFQENSEEIMTVSRMELPMPLRISLSTTSMIWQHPPKFMKALKRRIKTGESHNTYLSKITELLKKRVRDISPIVGFEKLWLLEPALREEVKDLCISEEDIMAFLQEPDKNPVQHANASRRRFKRWDVEDLQGFIQHTIEAEVLNIGMTGLACETEMPLRIGSIHHIRLNHEHGEVSLVGKVAWCRLTQSNKTSANGKKLVYLTGLEFENTLSPEGQEARFFFNGLAKVDVNRRVFGRFHYSTENDHSSSIEMGERVPFKVLKVSFAGLQILTDSPPGEEDLQLEILVGDEKLQVLGRVANIKEVDDPTGKYLVGVEFVQLDELSKKTLSGLVERILKE